MIPDAELLLLLAVEDSVLADPDGVLLLDVSVDSPSEESVAPPVESDEPTLLPDTVSSPDEP